MAAYLKKPFSHNPLIARKLLIRVSYFRISFSFLVLPSLVPPLAKSAISASRAQGRIAESDLLEVLRNTGFMVASGLVISEANLWVDGRDGARAASQQP